jgi:hypothetical protein
MRYSPRGRDPAAGDENLYRYVRDDPISLQDPTGLVVSGGGGDSGGGAWQPPPGVPGDTGQPGPPRPGPCDGDVPAPPQKSPTAGTDFVGRPMAKDGYSASDLLGMLKQSRQATDLLNQATAEVKKRGGTISISFGTLMSGTQQVPSWSEPEAVGQEPAPDGTMIRSRLGQIGISYNAPKDKAIQYLVYELANLSQSGSAAKLMGQARHKAISLKDFQNGLFAIEAQSRQREVDVVGASLGAWACTPVSKALPGYGAVTAGFLRPDQYADRFRRAVGGEGGLFQDKDMGDVGRLAWMLDRYSQLFGTLGTQGVLPGQPQ